MPTRAAMKIAALTKAISVISTRSGRQLVVARHGARRMVDGVLIMVFPLLTRQPPQDTRSTGAI
jgi:hypothetical protein